MLNAEFLMSATALAPNVSTPTFKEKPPKVCKRTLDKSKYAIQYLAIVRLISSIVSINQMQCLSEEYCIENPTFLKPFDRYTNQL